MPVFEFYIRTKDPTCNLYSITESVFRNRIDAEYIIKKSIYQ